MDAGIEHSFLNDRWTLTFKVKNLTDRTVFSDLNRPLPGRSFAFKIKYIMK
jgi:outer membrane receptor protein involved in Fe transport